MCAGRESNSGLVRGRDVYYHCTTGADTSVSHGHAHPTHENGTGAGTSEASSVGGPNKGTALRKLWRNGSALDSRPKGWGFESL